MHFRRYLEWLSRPTNDAYQVSFNECDLKLTRKDVPDAFGATDLLSDFTQTTLKQSCGAINARSELTIVFGVNPEGQVIGVEVERFAELVRRNLCTY